MLSDSTPKREIRISIFTASHHVQRLKPITPIELLAAIATALGNCGRGYAHVDEARQILNRIVDYQDGDARAAAQNAVSQLQDIQHESGKGHHC